MAEFFKGLYKGLVDLGYEKRVNGEENLEILKDNKPVIVYFNHLAGDDPILVTSLILSKVESERLVIPVSSEHLSLIGGLPLYAIGVLAARRLLNWSMPEVIQSYRLRDERLTKSRLQEKEEISSKLAVSLFKEIKKRLQNDNKPVIVIAPEGHRSDQGLLPAEQGAGALFKLIRNYEGVALPIGLVFPDQYKRGLNFNPRRRFEVKINIGSPLTYDQMMNLGEDLYKNQGLSFNQEPIQIAHTLMYYLKDLLPESFHGYYHQSNLRDTLAGRFESAINSKGEFYVRDTNERDKDKEIK